ncbi:hypothetical protein LXL04_028724 [Taraxacum kok-saghyz]
MGYLPSTSSSSSERRIKTGLNLEVDGDYTVDVKGHRKWCSRGRISAGEALQSTSQQQLSTNCRLDQSKQLIVNKSCRIIDKRQMQQRYRSMRARLHWIREIERRDDEIDDETGLQPQRLQSIREIERRDDEIDDETGLQPQRLQRDETTRLTMKRGSSLNDYKGAHNQSPQPLEIERLLYFLVIVFFSGLASGGNGSSI